MEGPPVIPTAVPERTNTFPAQLRFWGIHCSLTALPSFIIAFTQFNSGRAVLAMVCGIATFVFGYAFLTATPIYGKIHTGLIGRSIKLGTRIRMIISLISLPLLIPIIGQNIDDMDGPAESMFFAPDFWFGYAAILIVFAVIGAVSKGGSGVGSVDDMFGNDFLTTYAITIVEGILISGSLIFIAFITLIILNFRRNRRQIPQQHIPHGPQA